jgi:heavy metal sensor kinase
MFDSVRTRLTFWYAGVLALSLVVFAFLVYYAASRIFYERQDESLRSTAQTVASAYLEELDEEQSVAKANQVVLNELVFPNRYVEVLDSTGKVVAWSSNLNNRVLNIPEPAQVEARTRGASFAVVDNVRVAVVRLSVTREVGYAVVAEPLNVIDEGLRRLRRAFLAGVPLILLLASAGGYFLARKSLSPIALMNRQTQHITAVNLSSRLDVMNPRDELGRLGTTINELLERLESSFKEQQRFVADASHELRTPLAILRGETDVALEQPRPPDEYRQSLILIKDEAERLSRIVEDLFILARQPLDLPTIVKESVDMNETVKDCVRAARVLAAQKNLELKLTEAPPLVLTGDEYLLKRMVLNLLDNAVKYTPEGGRIWVEVAGQNGDAQVSVRDTGIGISEKDQSHVFDRFYRVDKARSRALGGAGLGLSIVLWIVEAHAGTITVESNPGKGSTFTVKLPTDPASYARLQ